MGCTICTCGCPAAVKRIEESVICWLQISSDDRMNVNRPKYFDFIKQVLNLQFIHFSSKTSYFVGLRWRLLKVNNARVSSASAPRWQFQVHKHSNYTAIVNLL